MSYELGLLRFIKGLILISFIFNKEEKKFMNHKICPEKYIFLNGAKMICFITGLFILAYPSLASPIVTLQFEEVLGKAVYAWECKSLTDSDDQQVQYEFAWAVNGKVIHTERKIRQDNKVADVSSMLNRQRIIYSNMTYIREVRLKLSYAALYNID